MLDTLPNHVLTLVLVYLEQGDLARAMCTCHRLLHLASDEFLWEELWRRRFGEANSLSRTACIAAGGWKNYFRERVCHGRAGIVGVGGQPLATTPSPNEKRSACLRLVPHDAVRPSIVFALDGSGSVSEDEFAEMTSFVLEATATVRESHPEIQVSVLQFSNDVREEWGMDLVPAGPAFYSACRGMIRMNGGTNISLAMQRAGQVMKRHTDPESHKSLVFVTDGRVDPYQAKEARQEAARLADEQLNITLFAFGVGRGVDRAELLSLLAAAPPRKACARGCGSSGPGSPASDASCSSGFALSPVASSGTPSSFGGRRGHSLSPSSSLSSTPPGTPSSFGAAAEGAVAAAGAKPFGADVCAKQQQRMSALAAARNSLRGLDLTPATERYLDLYVREDAAW